MADGPGLGPIFPVVSVVFVMGAFGGAVAMFLAGTEPGGLRFFVGTATAALGALAGWAVVFGAWGPPQGLVPSRDEDRETGSTSGRPGAVEIYQSTLMHIWSDGVVTLKEAKTLANLRRKLEISDEAGQRLEDDVKEVLFGKEATNESS